MTIMGLVLYGSIAILPLFLQTLLGYPALQSGLTVSPRGFGSIVGTVLIARLIGKIDGRAIIVPGLFLLAYTTSLFGDLNLQVASRNVMWPNIFNGFATSLIFVPLTTMTMGTLSNEQMGNATGIFNLMRNLGGSVGIAGVTTLLSRRAQVHQAMMVGHLTPYDPAYQNWINTVSSGLGASVVPGRDAVAQAHGVLYAELVRQARLWSYVDCFRLLAGLTLLCVPVALVFRRPRRKGPAVAH
jgi:DHA2 family multidrug resistance protein